MKNKILEILEKYGQVSSSVSSLLGVNDAADEICQMMADEMASIYMAMELENNKTTISLKERVRAHLEYKTFSPQQIDNALNKLK